jgi:hypothetical protein
VAVGHSYNKVVDREGAVVAIADSAVEVVVAALKPPTRMNEIAP